MLEISASEATISVSSVDDNLPLVMFNGKYNVTLVPGMTGNNLNNIHYNINILITICVLIL